MKNIKSTDNSKFYEIQYTGKFDILTYFFRTNSVVVLSPDCIYKY